MVLSGQMNSTEPQVYTVELDKVFLPLEHLDAHRGNLEADRPPGDGFRSGAGWCSGNLNQGMRTIGDSLEYVPELSITQSIKRMLFDKTREQWAELLRTRAELFERPVLDKA